MIFTGLLLQGLMAYGLFEEVDTQGLVTSYGCLCTQEVSIVVAKANNIVEINFFISTSLSANKIFLIVAYK